MRLHAAIFALTADAASRQAALKTVEEAGRSFKTGGDRLAAIASADGGKLQQQTLALVDAC